jgi:hypothetical protein
MAGPPCAQAFHASPDQLIGQPVDDAAVAPPLMVEVQQGSEEAVAGPAALMAAAGGEGAGKAPGGGSNYAFSATYRLRHLKGDDVLQW